ncbi:hypothetical protein [Yoonia sp.]|uniref:hypothetical protein n=1 Tax=Yoonia sp. TaxID=2212373 RepID=UPI003976C01B
MMKHSGLHAARGQIAWIIALIVSTAIVVKLEQLELGSRLSALSSNPLAQTELTADIILEQARLRAADPANAAVTDQVHLLIALSLAGTLEGADLDALTDEAARTIAAIERIAPSDPVLLDAVALCRSVFSF